MKKITWSEFDNIMWQHNKEAGITVKGTDPHPITGVVVFKQGPWFNREYSEHSRSYRVSSSNKWFLPNIGRSIFADCLDGTDSDVRLDYYMKECGGDWEVDYCYMISEVE